MLVSQLTSAVVKVNGNQLCYKRVSSAFKSYVTYMLVARQNVAETIGMLWQRDRSSVLQKTYSIIIALCIAQRGAGL